jgi:hypothetical protein
VPNPQSPDKTIPPLSGQDFRKEFNTDAKIIAVIRSGSVIGKAPIVSMSVAHSRELRFGSPRGGPRIADPGRAVRRLLSRGVDLRCEVSATRGDAPVATLPAGCDGRRRGARAQRSASSGVAGSCVRAPLARRATPLATAALATASATDSATRRLKTLGMM